MPELRTDFILINSSFNEDKFYYQIRYDLIQGFEYEVSIYILGTNNETMKWNQKISKFFCLSLTL